jgi:uncharacterized protein
MDFRVSVLGFVVGFLVGLTGMGGGALMTPLLILLGWAKPFVAVGTDLVWGAVTKAVGALVHYRQKTVDFAIVKPLALGSIPGACSGILLLAHLRLRGGNIMDRVVVRTLGVALVCVALTLLLRCLRGNRTQIKGDPTKLTTYVRITCLMGACIGFLVSITSVGSGSLIMACLVVLYPDRPLKQIVGSDIFHALLLVCVSAVGHIGLGDVNGHLLLGLLLGSVPGVWVGSKMSAVFPENIMRPVLAATLLCLGYKLL